MTVKHIEDLLGQQDYRFGYTPLNQLQSEQGHRKHLYQVDSIDNRQSKDQNSYTLDQLNQLLKDQDSSYKYDLDGNLIQKKQNGQTTTYQYDALNRLTQVKSPQGTFDYRYDSFNRRLSKTSKNLSERYLYQGHNEIGMIDAQGQIQELRILGTGHGAELGAAIALEIKGHTYAPIHDHQGHVVGFIHAATGQPSEAYRYTTFGEETLINAQGKVIQSSEVGNPWRFASKRIDPETGWVYFGRRFYDPANGRWTTTDPLGFADGPNLYAYLHHSPLSAFDAYGLVGEAYADSFYAGTHTPSYAEFSNERGDTICYDTNSCQLWTKPTNELNYSEIFIQSLNYGLDNPYSLAWQNTGINLALNIWQTDFPAVHTTPPINQDLVANLIDRCGELLGSSLILLPIAKGTSLLGYFGNRIIREVGQSIYNRFNGNSSQSSSTIIEDAQIANEIIEVNRAESFAGYRHYPLYYAPYQRVRNSPTSIGRRSYSGHAQDKMQDRGIFPSSVENAIQNGAKYEGKESNTALYYDSANNLSVIVDTNNGNVITTSFGFIRQ